MNLLPDRVVPFHSLGPRYLRISSWLWRIFPSIENQFIESSCNIDRFEITNRAGQVRALCRMYVYIYKCCPTRSCNALWQGVAVGYGARCIVGEWGRHYTYQNRTELYPVMVPPLCRRLERHNSFLLNNTSDRSIILILVGKFIFNKPRFFQATI